MSAVHHHKPSPLMAIHLTSLPLQEVKVDGQLRHQRLHGILQGPSALVPPVVDHLVVDAPVLTFVSFVEGVAAGVRVTSNIIDGVDAIDVRVHRDTGIEIYARSLKNAAVLIEIFLPSPFALRVFEARGSGKIVIEDRAFLANDPYADVHIHQAGECEVFVTSNSDMNVNSLTLEPHEGGLIQFTASTVTVRDCLHAKVPALGSLQCIMDKLKTPLFKIETAGYGDIQVEITEVDAMAKLTASAVGESSIKITSDFLRVDQLSSTTSGNGKVAISSERELHANYVHCSADGCSETQFASHHALVNVTHLSVAGKAIVDARDLLAREANIHVAGAGTVVFQASEAAHVDSNGYGTATLAGVLPPRITGNPIPSPEMPLLIDTLISSPVHAVAVAVPSRDHAYEPPSHHEAPAGFLAAMKSLLTGGPAHDGTGAQP